MTIETYLLDKTDGELAGYLALHLPLKAPENLHQSNHQLVIGAVRYFLIVIRVTLALWSYQIDNFRPTRRGGESIFNTGSLITKTDTTSLYLTLLGKTCDGDSI